MTGQRGHMLRTSEPSGPCSISPASYSVSPASGRPSMATSVSRGAMPARSAGPPAEGVITWSKGSYQF